LLAPVRRSKLSEDLKEQKCCKVVRTFLMLDKRVKVCCGGSVSRTLFQVKCSAMRMMDQVIDRTCERSHQQRADGLGGENKERDISQVSLCMREIMQTAGENSVQGSKG
jgi:hypothetical protein